MGTWCPVGTPRSNVHGAVIALGMEPLATVGFLSLGLLICVVLMMHMDCWLYTLTVFTECVLRLQVRLEVGLLAADTDALYASLLRSLHSHCSTASTHLTTVEVKVNRFL